MRDSVTTDEFVHDTRQDRREYMDDASEDDLRNFGHDQSIGMLSALLPDSDVIELNKQLAAMERVIQQDHSKPFAREVTK